MGCKARFPGSTIQPEDDGSSPNRHRSCLFVIQAEFVAQDIVTMDGIDGVLAEPALAGHFAGGRGAMRGNGVGELLTQIKIATDAFLVEAIETEHRSRVIEVDRVFELG